MTDEGIGIHIIRKLIYYGYQSKNVDLVELGAPLISVVHTIAGRKKAILIDCAQMGEIPGTILQFTPDEIVSTKVLSHYSLHEADLLNALDISRKLGEYPQSVVFFGIQPESIKPGEYLSTQLKQKLPDYINMIVQEIIKD